MTHDLTSKMSFEMPIKLSDLGKEHLTDVQTLLSQLGLYPSSEIDGIYGVKTQEAWGKFKQSHSLSDDELISLTSQIKLHDLATKKAESAIDIPWNIVLSDNE